MTTPLEYELLLQNGQPDTAVTSAIKERLSQQNRIRYNRNNPATFSTNLRSRLKAAGVISLDGRMTYGPMPVLSAFAEADPDWTIHEVKESEVGMLDVIAFQYYGSGYEDFWWVIAYANQIIEPDVEMYVGQRLVIPFRKLVVDFATSKSTNGLGVSTE